MKRILKLMSGNWAFTCNPQSARVLQLRKVSRLQQSQTEFHVEEVKVFLGKLYLHTICRDWRILDSRILEHSQKV